MDEEMKKKVTIGIVVGCIAIAVAITVITNWGGGSAGPKNEGQMQFLCINPKCGHAFEASGDEINKRRGEGLSMAEMPPTKCPQCGQNSAYFAIKCEKCGNVFIPNYENAKEYDKCPKCGFSKSEQMRKK